MSGGGGKGLGTNEGRRFSFLVSIGDVDGNIEVCL